MSFFYIDSNIGARTTGGGTTLQTGSMATLGAANVYANRALAIADGASGGDFLMGADNHSHDYAANTTLAGPTSGVPIKCISVDTNNIDQFKAGAYEQSTGANDLFYSGDWEIDGWTTESGDDIGQIVGDSSLVYRNGVMRVSASGDSIRLDISTKIIDTELKLDHVGSIMHASGASAASIEGGSVTTTSAGINALFGSLQGSVRVSGTNLVAVTGDIVFYGGGNTDNKFDFKMSKCPIDSGVALMGETFARPGSTFLATECSSDSDAAEYQYHYEDFYGIAEDVDDLGIHRAESEPFPGGVQSSLKITTNSNCEQTTPFSFRPFTSFAELSVASTDTIRLYFVIDDAVTLTDTEVSARLVYPDGTSKNVFNSLTNRNVDILAAGTTHTTDSTSDWRLNNVDPLTGFNEYQMDLDTSVDVGADGVPQLWIDIGIDTTSTPIYLDRMFDTVA